MSEIIIRAENLVKSYAAFSAKGNAAARSETTRSETTRSETTRSETTRSETTRSETTRSEPILRGVGLEVRRGEIMAIVGASGAGKSTLLHLLGALDEPDEGGVELILSDAERYAYNALSDEALSELRNKRVGFIFQFHHLLPEFTAAENVMMPALIAGESQKTALARACELLEQAGLADCLRRKPDALSGGEQQRVAFARALANKPAVVFADEPTGNLDHANSERLFEHIRRFREQNGQTFVVVTHSKELAAAADRTFVLADGLLREAE